MQDADTGQVSTAAAEVYEEFFVPALFAQFAGAVCDAAAIGRGQAVLDVMLEPGFFERVEAMGDRLRAAFEQMIPNHDHLFDEIRGKGLMLGIKLKEPAVARDFVAHLRDNHGLLTVAAGENVFRVLPPLVIDESHIAECVERLSAGARSYTPLADD